MAESRFLELRQQLLQAGVAPRHARRAILEIESHHQQLIDEEALLGAAEHEARSEAHRRLGTNEELVRCYAARPELRAWARRWPTLCFTIVPLLSYLFVGFTTLMGISWIAELMGPHLHRMRIAPHLTSDIDLVAGIIFLWCLPLGVAASFARLARRRGVAFRWPVLCVVSISILASLCNVAVRITGGPDSGEVGAGIGFSPESLPRQSMHAAILVALSLVLLWTLRRAQRYHDLN